MRRKQERKWKVGGLTDNHTSAVKNSNRRHRLCFHLLFSVFSSYWSSFPSLFFLQILVNYYINAQSFFFSIFIAQTPTHLPSFTPVAFTLPTFHAWALSSFLQVYVETKNVQEQWMSWESVKDDTLNSETFFKCLTWHMGVDFHYFIGHLFVQVL